MAPYPIVRWPIQTGGARAGASAIDYALPVAGVRGKHAGSPLALSIDGLSWPAGSEEHVERHLPAWEIDDLIEGGDFVIFPNKDGHPPKRWRVIGRTPDRRPVTAILQEPADGDSTQWVVITGWRSSDTERKLYEQHRQRPRRKRGR